MDPPDLLERTFLTDLRHISQKPGTTFVLMVFKDLQVIDYTDLTVTTV